MEMAEERISTLKDRSVEVVQSVTIVESLGKKMSRAAMPFCTILRGLTL